MRHGRIFGCIMVFAVVGFLPTGVGALKAEAGDTLAQTLALPPPEDGETQLEESEEKTAPSTSADPLPPDPSAPSDPVAREPDAASDEPLVEGTPPPESSGSTLGLIWFGVVFVVLVCVIYLFL